MNLTPLKKKAFEFQKQGDTEKVSALRYLLSQIQNKEIDARAEGKELSKEDVLKVIKKEIKKRKEASEIYRDAKRADLADKEAREADILEEIMGYVETL